MQNFKVGDIELNQKSLKNKNVRAIRETGLAHISEDRMTYGCSQNSSIWENLVSDRYFNKKYIKGGLFNFKPIEDFAKEAVDKFKIKCDDIFQPVRMLSGGNIQKVVVAREFTSDTNLIVANQPTRGIDVGATELIRKELIRLTREENKGVLLISADLNEVLELSDSLIVMVEGEIVAYFEDASKVDEYELGNYMLGLEKHSDEQIGRLIHEN
jgi:simple sugar transport system ATP-binding protein